MKIESSEIITSTIKQETELEMNCVTLFCYWGGTTCDGPHGVMYNKPPNKAIKVCRGIQFDEFVDHIYRATSMDKKHHLIKVMCRYPSVGIGKAITYVLLPVKDNGDIDIMFHMLTLHQEVSTLDLYLEVEDIAPVQHTEMAPRNHEAVVPKEESSNELLVNNTSISIPLVEDRLKKKKKTPPSPSSLSEKSDFVGKSNVQNMLSSSGVSEKLKNVQNMLSLSGVPVTSSFNKTELLSASECVVNLETDSDSTSDSESVREREERRKQNFEKINNDRAKQQAEETGRTIVQARARGRGDQKEPVIVVPQLPRVPHRWLDFPADIPNVLRADYITRLAKYIHRDVEVGVTLNWTLFDTLRSTAPITLHLTQRYRSAEGAVLFTCTAWRRLFSIHEPLYRELMLEFFSTVTFVDTSTDYTDPQVFRFRLGGQDRQCSLVEFSWRLGLYTLEETQHPQFLPFLTACMRGSPTIFKPKEFWSTIAHDFYNPSSAQERSLSQPIHRLLHRLIATTISHRRGREETTTIDLFYMWCILTPNLLCHVPFGVALFLSRRATGVHQRSALCGGQLITRLARSYEILTPQEISLFTTYQPRRMTKPFLETMGVIIPDGGVRILDDEPARGDERDSDKEEEMEHETPAQETTVQPRRRVRPRNEAVTPDRDDTLSAMERKIDWMATSLREFFEFQGFTPSRSLPR